MSGPQPERRHSRLHRTMISIALDFGTPRMYEVLCYEWTDRLPSKKAQEPGEANDESVRHRPSHFEWPPAAEDHMECGLQDEKRFDVLSHRWGPEDEHGAFEKQAWRDLVCSPTWAARPRWLHSPHHLAAGGEKRWQLGSLSLGAQSDLVDSRSQEIDGAMCLGGRPNHRCEFRAAWTASNHAVQRPPDSQWRKAREPDIQDCLFENTFPAHWRCVSSTEQGDSPLMEIRSCRRWRCSQCWIALSRGLSKVVLAATTPVLIFSTQSYAQEHMLPSSNPDPLSWFFLTKRVWPSEQPSSPEYLVQFASDVVPRWLAKPSPATFSLLTITAALSLRYYAYLNRKDRYQAWFVGGGVISSLVVQMLLKGDLLVCLLGVLPWLTLVALLLSDAAHSLARKHSTRTVLIELVPVEATSSKGASLTACTA